MAILISSKVDFRAKRITRDKEKHYIMLKASTNQENIAILNVCTSNNRTAECMKQNLIKLKGEVDKSTIIVEYFDTPLSETDGTTRQKSSKDVEELNSTISQQDLIDIYRTLKLTTADHTFFSSARGIFARIDHTLSD